MTATEDRIMVTPLMPLRDDTPSSPFLAPGTPPPLVLPDITLADLSTPLGINESSQSLRPSTSRVFWLLLKHTAVYVALGIIFMLLGIIIFQFALLPKIYTCPTGAVCADSFDPNTSNVLQLLQTAMNWWLKIGLIVSGFGLLKLSAYQTWFVMMRRGNTIKNLDLTLGAIKGSLLDTCYLVFRRGNTFVSLLLLSQIGIGAAIGLFVGLSIVRSPGTRMVTFLFSPVSQLPDSNVDNLNTDGQLRAIAKVNGWALTNDTTHDNALRGSLVVPDGRSNSSVHAIADGPRITGRINCTGVSNDFIIKNTTNSTTYHISHRTKDYIAQPDMLLSVCMTGVGTATSTYLWVSNTTGLLPNASTTLDGAMHVALCQHDIFFENILLDSSFERFRPNTAMVSSCKSLDQGVCVADSVSNAIVSWWGGKGTSFWGVSCRGGVIGPLKRTPPFCPLTNELWAETVTSMLDGLMRTGNSSGMDNQILNARVQAISDKWWWMQGIIPLLTLALYALTLAYTCYISQGSTVFKSLSLEEIINAAQTEHVRNLVHSGRLRKSTMRYDEGGFTEERAK